jgi:HEAT repeat protein
MPLFGPPNVEKLKARGNTKGLIKALDYSKSTNVRIDAAKALGEIGDAQAMELLITALGDENSDVRAAVANALGGIGGLEAVEPLIITLDDESENVRSATAEALGEIGDARAVEPLIAALIAALKDKASGMSQAAARALGEIGTPAVEPLTAALKDSNSVVRWAAVRALGEMGAPAVELLTAALKDSDLFIRWAAATALGEMGKPAVEPLITALKDGDSLVRQVAINALETIGWQASQDESGAAYWIAKQEWSRCSEIGAPAVEPLIATLKDREPVVRKFAAKALGEIGDTRAIEPLTAMLDDQDSIVPETVAQALDVLSWRPRRDATGAAYWIAKGECGKCVKIGQRAVEPLITALKHVNSHVRESAAKALGEIGDARAVEPLIAALKDINWGESENTTDARRKRGTRRRADVLQDKDPQVTQATLKAMGTTQAAFAGFLDFQDAFEERQRESEKWRQLEDAAERSLMARATLEALVQIGSHAVEPLIAVLEDREPNVRLHAAKALGQIGDARAVEPLIAALKDSNEEVRATAVGALIPIDDERAIEALVGNAVDMLTALYDASPKGGFVAYEAEAEPVKAIGRFLDELGGLDLMLRAHTLFAASRRQSARNLEMVWDHIGEWLG